MWETLSNKPWEQERGVVMDVPFEGFDRTQDPGEDPLAPSIQHALCKDCGQWYDWNNYHGSASPQHAAVDILRGKKSYVTKGLELEEGFEVRS